MLTFTVFDLFVVDKYFDIKEFKNNPLKTHIKNEYRPLTNLLKGATLYKMKRSKISV
jgi:hypothetical protein